MRLFLILFFSLGLWSCNDVAAGHHAVYVLIDRSDIYGKEFDKVTAAVKLLLARMDQGDSLALTRIDNEIFSDKNVVTAVTFSSRPSQANAQKRAVLHNLDQLAEVLQVGSYTDVTGGMLQAMTWLNATDASNKLIIVFSTFPEEPRQGYMREFPVDFAGVQVVVLNVSQAEPGVGEMLTETRSFAERAQAWQQRVSAGGGSWRLINDVTELKPLLQ
jgi:hypothetical protein